MIYTEFFGWVTIDYWEYVVSFLYIVVMYVYFARIKNVNIKKYPEYRYMLPGLVSKTIGGLFCGVIYFYYYGNGDTISYFYSALPLGNLAMSAPLTYLKVLFGANDPAHYQLFSLSTGYPMLYVFEDTRTYMLTRLISPLFLVSFKSFLVTTVLVASVSYFGVWRCYQTFYRYFPSLHRELALAVLFMPSSLFWGSSILKDTFTFSALCWWVYGVDQLFFIRRDKIYPVVIIMVSAFVLLSMKPYIFMIIFPMSVLWIFYSRISRIRNTLIKYLVVPFGLALFLGISFITLNALGQSLGKFSMDNALETIIVSQNDMKKADYYGANFHDVGVIEPTWGSVLSKFPQATNATLFRPYLWESRNAVMMLAGIENTFLIILFGYTMFKTRVVGLFQCMRKNPLVMLCMAFTFIYGFIAGITTPNFGALVRFKIPLLPFFVCGMYITLFLLKEKRRAKVQGTVFRWEDYQRGQPDALAVIARMRAGRKV